MTPARWGWEGGAELRVCGGLEKSRCIHTSFTLGFRARHPSERRTGKNMQAAVRAGRICTRRLSSASSQKQALAAQRYNQAVVDGIVKEKPVVLVNKTLIEHYATLLHERPLLTNATTSGVLCAVGDVLAQLIEWRASSSTTILEDSWEGSNRAPRAPASLDAARTGRMAIYGFFICGPLLTGWYKGLNAISEALSVSYRVTCPTPCPLKFAIVTSPHPRESHHIL